MARLPKAKAWTSEIAAKKIIGRSTQCDHFQAQDAVISAAKDGTVKTRKISSDGIDPVALRPEYWHDDERIMNDRNMQIRFEINLSDLMQWIGEPVAKLEKTRRRRPPIYDWEAFYVQAIIWAQHPDGLPVSQAEFEKKWQRGSKTRWGLHRPRVKLEKRPDVFIESSADKTFSASPADTQNRRMRVPLMCRAAVGATRQEENMQKIARDRHRREVTGLSRRQWDCLELAGRAPRRIKLSDRSVGWLVDELQTWLAERAAERNAAA